MVNLVIIGEVFLAVLLALAGYLYYTGAEEFCQRMVTRSDTQRQPWRAILYPAWFYKSQRCVWQMRITGIGSMLVSALLTVIAAITILKGARLSHVHHLTMRWSERLAALAPHLG